MIKLFHVSKSFGREDHALVDVNLRLEKGEFAFLMGHSGAGKSTLMKLVFAAEAATQGHVVNISSMGGVQGTAKFSGLSAYSSSKGGLIILTELLAEEFKESGPAFNALALGAVQTEMLEEAFPGYKSPISASEIATYILEFALKGQQFYNGKVLPIASTTP